MMTRDEAEDFKRGMREAGPFPPQPTSNPTEWVDPVCIVVHFNDGDNSEIGYDDEQYAHLDRDQARNLIAQLEAALSIDLPSEPLDLEIRIIQDVNHIATN